MRSWLSPSHPRFELALAVAMAIGVELELLGHGLLHTPVDAIAAASVGLPLAFRFRWPLPTVTVVSLAGVAIGRLVADPGVVMLPVIAALLALYAVGSRCTGWRFWAGGAITGVCLGASMISQEGVNGDLFLAAAVPAAGLLIGRALGVLRVETDVLEERASELERERDRAAGLAVQHERSRIARELHDVIGHSISVMGVQAGAVRSVLPAEQHREREALMAVERAGRDAVGEMRRLLGLLRDEGDASLGPTPSLSRIETLAAEMRDAGQRLTVEVEGDLALLPPGVDLAGYRVVQEALTNTLKHAPGAEVRARVARDQHQLVIEVADGGPSVTTPNGHVGHGLLGMRERVTLYGGELSAGPQPGGGFRVHGRIPLGAA